jgi:pyridoxine 5-phosphate synthase
MARLNVNIDHVATLRQARRTIEPSVATAALECEKAGASGITIHLRQDRRHIQDSDAFALKQVVSTYLNIEMAATSEMLEIAEKMVPDAITLVPESPGEITTEGGLDIVSNFAQVSDAVKVLQKAGIFVSIFIDPVKEQILAAKECSASQIEISTARYAELTLGSRAFHPEGKQLAEEEISRINQAAQDARALGLLVAAGHGLTTRNIKPIAQISEIEEFNIGHHIISRSVFIGLESAVREMLLAINSEI